MNGRPVIPAPVNEPVHGYAPASDEKQALKQELHRQMESKLDIPVIIGGREIRTSKTEHCVCPHDHRHILGTYHRAGAKEVELAIKAALGARQAWAAMPFESRAAIFLKAADLLSGPYRAVMNAATMLCQSKNPFQAEIDCVCELADFWRFNVHYAQEIYAQQPPVSPRGVWNYVEQRPLEGFVFAVTPFNFTSIAGNLPTAPAIMGNVVLWKPASSAVYSAYHVMKILKEAGLPDGVINMVPGSGAEVGDPVLESEHLAGIHFTGSTKVFQQMWSTVGRNISRYRTYPRLVGETGGKDYIFAHPSADARAVAVAIVRGAFEYQGQKCSAASRAYIPKSLWAAVRGQVEIMANSIAVGDIMDFRNYVNAVIDKNAFRTIKGYIDHAAKSKDAEIIVGGKCDDSVGYFVYPTVILAKTPDFKTMVEEIFGPVITVYVYDDRKLEETLALCDSSSAYGLTGAIFARERAAIVQMSRALENSAGNFYINDKPTGAVVGQQPFGGARASGTNDKAGSMLNLLRWTSPRAVKETFVPALDYTYPFMDEE
ncbi:MAG: L-glutamate gamma-semialdehyde dehydrogenase [Elusimicrobiaceae bacterium]|nr:L-glutamate gamma-semialdehyde dehydrogenase [Elusimicrobiaceae bacterium]